MINDAMKFLAGQLDQFCKHSLGGEETIAKAVHLAEPGDAAGTPKLALTLVNIEKDTMPYRQRDLSGVRSGPDAGLAVYSAPLYLNLYVMLAADPQGDYDGALKKISLAINFFQLHPVFDHQTNPDLDPGIEKLILDIANLGLHDLHNVWGLLGGKYLPSVFYKVRMVVVDANAMLRSVPQITQIDSQASVVKPGV